MIRIICLAMVGMFLLWTPVSQAGTRKRGRIDAARQRVKANKAKAKSYRSSSKKSDDRDAKEDSDSYEDSDSNSSYRGKKISGKALVRALAFPFWGPASAIGDHPMRIGGYRFARYPYADANGHARQLSNLFVVGAPPVRGRQISVRLQSSYERLASNLDGLRLRATLRTVSRFNLDGSVTRYQENLGDGETDSLWHYKVLGMYSFAVSPRVHMSAGAGVRSLVFKGGEDAIGTIVRYSAEFFPVSPTHIWISGEVGGGRGGVMAEFELGAGVLLRQVELFAGYRAFQVAGVPFQGPQVGLMLWL